MIDPFWAVIVTQTVVVVGMFLERSRTAKRSEVRAGEATTTTDVLLDIIKDLRAENQKLKARRDKEPSR